MRACSKTLVGAAGTAEGRLQLEHQRQEPGGVGPDLGPTSGARGALWPRSGNPAGIQRRVGQPSLMLQQQQSWSDSTTSSGTTSGRTNIKNNEH